MVTLDTLRKLHEHDHQLAAYCPKCRRWAVLDLARLIAEGRGKYCFVGRNRAAATAAGQAFGNSGRLLCDRASAPDSTCEKLRADGPQFGKQWLDMLPTVPAQLFFEMEDALRQIREFPPATCPLRNSGTTGNHPATIENAAMN